MMPLTVFKADLELMAKVVTFETLPPMVALPVPELIVRAEPVEPYLTITIPEPPLPEAAPVESPAPPPAPVFAKPLLVVVDP